MALRSQSLFLYNIVITTSNQNIPFQAASLGPQFNGVIPLGTYALSQLATAIASAMNVADSANIYTATVDRTADGGQGNRITISTNGSFLSLLFNTGTTALTSIRDLCSFGHLDLTGATSYQNSATTGVTLLTSWYGHNYSPPQVNLKNYGTVNVSTDGTKEGITWALQQFIEVEFQYEAQANVFASWNPLLIWMIEQNPFEFTPEYTNPTTFYTVTLEKSGADGKGLAFIMKEMLPDFPFMFTTGPFTMRLTPAG